MKKFSLRLVSLCLLSIATTACNPSDPDNYREKKDVEKSDQENEQNGSDQKSTLDGEKKSVKEVVSDNGIRINWFKKGEGALVADGDVISIDYKVLLMDNSIVDGNHLLNKPSVPFMVGFKMQTEGWDIALKQLRVGDFAEIFIPANLARGEKGIKDLIPPNADNILRIRVLAKVKPTRAVDGNKVWVFEENTNNKTKFNEENEIVFHCMVSSPTNPLYINTYQTNNPFKLRLEDSGTVPGLKKALINAKKSDRMFIFVPASEAYGAKGYLDVVKPNEDLFYNILTMDITEK